MPDKWAGKHSPCLKGLAALFMSTSRQSNKEESKFRDWKHGGEKRQKAKTGQNVAPPH